jgi:hypothetical protein
VGASAKSFGSRFWVLSSEFEGSDDEIWEDDGAVEGVVGDQGVGSPPPSRTLGDFLGLAQEGGWARRAFRVSPELLWAELAGKGSRPPPLPFGFSAALGG